MGYLTAHPMYEIDTAKYRLSHEEFLSYYYNCGLCCLECQNYSLGVFYLEQVLSLPADRLLDVMVDAHRRLLLVSLIAHGKMYSLPQ